MSDPFAAAMRRNLQAAIRVPLGPSDVIDMLGLYIDESTFRAMCAEAGVDADAIIGPAPSLTVTRL